VRGFLVSHYDRSANVESGSTRVLVDTEGARSMGSLKNKLSKFAKSSKGRKLRDTAMRKAKDPKVRAKIAKKFGKKG
jgi:acetolactate synthase regulatory subunit